MFWYQYIKFSNHSPTIPFIVGAYRLIDNSQKFCVQDFFSEVSKTQVPEDEEILIRICSTLDEYVLFRSFALGYSSPSPIPLKDYRTLGYESSAKHLGLDYELVIDELVRKYTDCLAAQEYSLDPDTKKWRSFNKEEVKMIENAARSFEKGI